MTHHQNKTKKPCHARGTRIALTTSAAFSKNYCICRLQMFDDHFKWSPFPLMMAHMMSPTIITEEEQFKKKKKTHSKVTLTRPEDSLRPSSVQQHWNVMHVLHHVTTWPLNTKLNVYSVWIDEVQRGLIWASWHCNSDLCFTLLNCVTVRYFAKAAQRDLETNLIWGAAL